MNPLFNSNLTNLLGLLSGNPNQIIALQLQNAVSGVVRYPTATTYTSGTNPFCGCNCGF